VVIVECSFVRFACNRFCTGLVLDRGGIARRRDFVLRRVFLCSSLVELSDTLLGPLQIALRLFGGFDAVSEVRLRGGQAAAGERLEFEQFARFGVELAGADGLISRRFSWFGDL
jgi:hypothetical protein